MGTPARRRLARCSRRCACTPSSSRLSFCTRWRITRRSDSSCVSPGPRVPMPPPRRSRCFHWPTSRGSRYVSCASSTWSLPSALRPRWRPPPAPPATPRRRRAAAWGAAAPPASHARARVPPRGRGRCRRARRLSPVVSPDPALLLESRLDRRRHTAGRLRGLDVDPLQLRLAGKPGPLPPRVAQRVALHEPPRLLHVESLLDHANELAVAETLHRRQRRRVAAREETTDLVLEAGGDHALRAPTQTVVEPRAIQREPDVDDVPLGVALTPARLSLACGAARPHQLERANDPHVVVRVQPPGQRGH